MTLEWHLGEDNVEAKLPVSAIEERGGGKVYRIQLLPYMAAAGSDENGYMVVPNGSGSLIRFNNGKNSAAVYSQYVYDMDLIDADADDSVCASAIVGRVPREHQRAGDD